MGPRWEVKERRQPVKSAPEKSAHGKNPGLVAERTGWHLLFFKMEDPRANFMMLWGTSEHKGD